MEIVDSAVLILSPVPAAAGNVGKLLVGVGLIAISAFMPATIGILGNVISSQAVGLYGANMVIGSIIEFLKKPNPEQKNSTIAGTVSTGAQGQPIPIVYGRTYVTPTVISGGTSIQDHSTYENRGDGGFFGIGGWSETYLAPRSTTKFQVVDALCEGPIGGLVNGEQGIWINGVPAKNSANQYSYLGLQTETYDLYGNKTVTVQSPTLRQGYGNDAALPSPWNYATGDVSVGQALKKITGSATRRVNKSNLDTISVRIYWQACNNYAGTDQLGGLRTAHQISIKEGNGAWVIRHVDDIYALSNSPFERQFNFTVGNAPYYEIKVERTIADQPADKSAIRVDVGTWKSYGIGIKSSLQYPHTSKVGLEVNLERFGATEIDRRYHINGKIIKIPSNATVRSDGSLQYAGLWNGAFIESWSSDPAWCLYDLLLNKRYGVGIKERKLDKFAFYASSTYCSELVPDGFGGMEPRFGLNCIIKERGAAYDLIQKLCSVFNSIAFYEAGAITPSTDKPRSIAHQFTGSNAIFKYSGTAWRSRRNKVTVAYDRSEAPDLRDYEFAESKNDILLRGVIENRTDAFGCNSRGQAKRVAKWSLYTEQYQKESIIIAAGIDGANVIPGQVVTVADRDRQSINRAGRIVSATTTSITIDEPVSLPTGVFTLSVTMDDGSIESRSISNTGNNLSTIDVTSAFSVAPSPESVWLISGYDVQPEQWLIMGRSESGLHQYELTGISYNPSKFAYIEQGLNLVEPPKPVVVPSPPLPPSNLQLSIVNGVGTSISVSWSPPSTATYTTGYQVQYKQVGNLLSSPISTTVNSYLIGTINGYGDYEVQVRAVDVNGSYSGWITESISIVFSTFAATSLLSSRSAITNNWNTSSKLIGDVFEPVFVTSISIQPEPQRSFAVCEKILLLN
jgi:predicted phage tail protein